MNKKQFDEKESTEFALNIFDQCLQKYIDIYFDNIISRRTTIKIIYEKIRRCQKITFDVLKCDFFKEIFLIVLQFHNSKTICSRITKKNVEISPIDMNLIETFLRKSSKKKFRKRLKEEYSKLLFNVASTIMRHVLYLKNRGCSLYLEKDRYDLIKIMNNETYIIRLLNGNEFNIFPLRIRNKLSPFLCTEYVFNDAMCYLSGITGNGLNMRYKNYDLNIKYE